MSDPDLPSILGPDDAPPAAVVNATGNGGICLVCEHASAAIPAAMDALGLAPADRYSHAVWDLGAEALSRRMSIMLDAPLVLGRVSRLVYDCNRPPEAADAIPARTERIIVPGNDNLSDEERAARTAAVYDPFHRKVAETLRATAARPIMVTIHSFTPIWNGQERDTEIGLLHDADDHLARSMLAAAGDDVKVALNEPYSAADGVTHTLKYHATAQGLGSVMIEVRNDLLASTEGTARIARILTDMLNAAVTKGVSAA